MVRNQEKEYPEYTRHLAEHHPGTCHGVRQTRMTLHHFLRQSFVWGHRECRYYLHTLTLAFLKYSSAGDFENYPVYSGKSLRDKRRDMSCGQADQFAVGGVKADASQTRKPG